MRLHGFTLRESGRNCLQRIWPTHLSLNALWLAAGYLASGLFLRELDLRNRMGKWQPAKTSMSPVFHFHSHSWHSPSWLSSGLSSVSKSLLNRSAGRGSLSGGIPPWEHHCALCPDCLPNKTSSQVHSEVMSSQIHEYDGGRTPLPSRGNHGYREA